MTNAELAILSLVSEQPRHGYEIGQVIEERGMRDWTEVGFSSIYYILKKLEKSGWVEGSIRQQPGRGPARKVYTITTEGRAAWQAGTLQALMEPHRCYTPFQLGLANLPGIPPVEGLAALHQYHDSLSEQRDYVRSRWERDKGEIPIQVDAMFDLSLTMINAELGWVYAFIQKLEEGNDG